LGFAGTCNPNFNYGALGFNTIWTPVKNFAFTADVTWGQLDQKNSGTISGPGTFAAGAAKPAAVYQLKSENSVTMLLRAQRNF
ncbi:porin, partial [Bradyrhizobium sp.]|uniref:porin n=1 Tax=Bradyrhizobium sp. TaxID=376 RepID=UPI003C133167